jgi:hypothetical protein
VVVEFGDAEFSALRELDRSVGAINAKFIKVGPCAWSIYRLYQSSVMTGMLHFSHLNPMIGTASTVSESCDPLLYLVIAVIVCGWIKQLFFLPSLSSLSVSQHRRPLMATHVCF